MAFGVNETIEILIVHNIEYTLRINGDDVSAGDYMTWVRQDVANANPGAECAAAFASLHTEMDCSACDAGASCGLCLMALAAGECPANPDLGSCELVAVDGELCEGDGECDTDNQHNNCEGYDVYKKVPCEDSPVSSGLVQGSNGINTVQLLLQGIIDAIDPLTTDNTSDTGTFFLCFADKSVGNWSDPPGPTGADFQYYNHEIGRAHV